MKHYNVLIVGGGTAGIMVAAQLKNAAKGISIAIADPSEYHWYQPAWTLVGAGTYDYDATRRNEKDLIPKGVDWIQDAVTDFRPAHNSLQTQNSGSFSYDYLVLCPGIQYNINDLPGLQEALQKENVCSNYIDARKTDKVLSNFKGGNAIFTLPATPIKCGGAPQKIMYLASDFFKKAGIKSKTKMAYYSPGSVIFGVKEFVPALLKVLEKDQIITRFQYNPVSIDAQKQELVFRHPSGPITEAMLNTQMGEQRISENEIAVRYDMLHLAPPQSAPDFIRNSEFAVTDGPNKGWLDVHINTLQHHRFQNVFGLGDAAALPTGKTGAAIRKQVPVVVANILSLIQQKTLSEKSYEGYSSCPIITGYGKMLLCEFKYNNVRDSDPLLTKIFDTTKDSYSMWILKKYGLPFLYWNLMMKGRM